MSSYSAMDLYILTRRRVKKLAMGAWIAALLTSLPGILLEGIGADPKFRVVWLNITIALGITTSILMYISISWCTLKYANEN